jgi:lipopolysaccharide biosynthesis glycosyltransferase
MNPERVRLVGADPSEYVNAGVMVLDLKKMREDRLQGDFEELARQDLEFQDQDVLNIRCRGRIAHLHPKYNVHCMLDYERCADICDRLWLRGEWTSAVENPAVLHFAGEKPWVGSGCFYYDVWWKWFHLSPAADREYYVAHQRRRMVGNVGNDRNPTVSSGFYSSRVFRRWLATAKAVVKLFKK